MDFIWQPRRQVPFVAIAVQDELQQEVYIPNGGGGATNFLIANILLYAPPPRFFAPSLPPSSLFPHTTLPLFHRGVQN
jgi:hypothetical protein